MGKEITSKQNQALAAKIRQIEILRARVFACWNTMSFWTRSSLEPFFPRPAQSMELSLMQCKSTIKSAEKAKHPSQTCIRIRRAIEILKQHASRSTFLFKLFFGQTTPWHCKVNHVGSSGKQVSLSPVPITKACHILGQRDPNISACQHVSIASCAWGGAELEDSFCAWLRVWIQLRDSPVVDPASFSSTPFPSKLANSACHVWTMKTLATRYPFFSTLGCVMVEVQSEISLPLLPISHQTNPNDSFLFLTGFASCCCSRASSSFWAPSFMAPHEFRFSWTTRSIPSNWIPNISRLLSHVPFNFLIFFSSSFAACCLWSSFETFLAVQFLPLLSSPHGDKTLFGKDISANPVRAPAAAAFVAGQALTCSVYALPYPLLAQFILPFTRIRLSTWRASIAWNKEYI